jgi:hypothetical protein
MARIHDLIDRLAAAEARFRGGQFLAPAVRGGVVFVCVAGVVCRFAVPKRFRGWGVFRLDGRHARPVRAASLAERQRYLDLFPRRPMVLVGRDGPDWLGWPAHHADARFGPPMVVPVRLAEDAQPFERVEARFDGSTAWFDRPDERADPAAAVYLRDALREMTPPEAIARPRLTAEERTAYRLAWETHRELLRDKTEDRLRDALAHAGAEFRGYVERPDAYRVEFTVDGRPHVSVVNKADLTVQLAGICLDGADRHFDLGSLVGVLRRADEVLRIGEDGMAESQYWEVHPPR